MGEERVCSSVHEGGASKNGNDVRILEMVYSRTNEMNEGM